MKEREAEVIAVAWVSHMFASQHAHIRFTIAHGSRSPEVMAAFYAELNKQMPWERTFSLAEIQRLYYQEERPTNPDQLRMWKIVRHSKHYGASKEQIEKFTQQEEEAIDDLFDRSGWPPRE